MPAIYVAALVVAGAFAALAVICYWSAYVRDEPATKSPR